MNFTLKDVLNQVIMKGASSTLFGKTGKMRGPNGTAEFIYECMIGVALELTDRLPQMFEDERRKYHHHQQFFYDYGNKGKYTDSYGWSKDGHSKMEFSFDPVFFHYFSRIITPFLGGRKKAWNDENSKIWKWIKKMILEGDKEKIGRLQRNIRNRILRESQKSIVKVAVNGRNNKTSGNGRIIQSSSL